MAKLSTDELLDAFKEMSLIELSEFVKNSEETFDVKAAAPVVAAAGAPAAAPVVPAVPAFALAVSTAIVAEIMTNAVIFAVTALALGEAGRHVGDRAGLNGLGPGRRGFAPGQGELGGQVVVPKFQQDLPALDPVALVHGQLLDLPAHGRRELGAAAGGHGAGPRVGDDRSHRAAPESGDGYGNRACAGEPHSQPRHHDDRRGYPCDAPDQSGAGHWAGPLGVVTLLR